MNTAAISLLIAAGVGFGFLVGWDAKKIRVVKVSDIFDTNKNRSEKQMRQDAVMQLKDELAETNAIKFKTLANGLTEVSMEVVV